MNEHFYKKSGMVIAKLSRDLIVLAQGERVPSLDEYALALEVSRGVVQQGLAYLCTQGCISLTKSHGKGTKLEWADREKLRFNTGWDLLTINMPVPGTACLQQLTTGLYQHNGVFPMPLAMVYVTGSDNRLYYLQRKTYDAVVVSLASARRYCAQHSFLEQPMVLDGCHYAGRFCAYFASSAAQQVEDGMRVAYDPASSDHMLVTQAMCQGKNVVWVETPYLALADALKHGKADVVFHRREFPMLQFEALQPQPVTLADTPWQDFTTPALLFHKENYGIRKLFEQYLSVPRVREIQRKVESGEMEPRFF